MYTVFPENTESIKRDILRIAQVNVAICILVNAATFVYAVRGYPTTAWTCVSVVALDIYILIGLLSGFHLWKLEEIVDVDLKKKSTCLCCLQRASLELPVLSWLSARPGLWFILTFSYSITLTLYVDLVASPTGASSCTTDYTTEGKIYSAQGAFSYSKPYTSTYIGKFCPQYQRYAYPDSLTVLSSPTETYGQIGQCEEGLNSNYLNSHLEGYPILGTLCAYPDLSVGLLNPPQEGSLVLYCPASRSARTYCIGPNGDKQSPPCKQGYASREGQPETICPSCLYYVGRTQPAPGYEHCAVYDEATPISPFCALCPDPYEPIYTDSLFYLQTVTYSIYTLSVLFTPYCIRYHGSKKIHIHKGGKPKPT